MTALKRRRDRCHREECWQIYYGDVRVGMIARRSGAPLSEPQWHWSCGFYPGTEPGEYQTGTAETFDLARADFEPAWRELLARRSEADFQAWRNAEAFTAWKYAMWDAGARLPTQMASGRSRCFCGAEIDIAGTDEHVRKVHSEMRP